MSASAPTRVDLAGGTLDIWPLSMIVADAATVNVAIGLRARVSIEARKGRTARFVSVDRGATQRCRLPIRETDLAGPLSWLVRLAAGFDLQQGFELRCEAEAPAGAGLGGSSALGIAAGAALARFAGERLGKDALLRRVMNLETRQLSVPTGNQDYLAAIHGGVATYHHEPDGTRREGLPGIAGLNRRLVVAYTEEPRNSGYSNWDMFRRFVEGERTTVRRMEAIADVARRMSAALAAEDLDAVGTLLGEEGNLRARLAPSVTTDAIRRAGRAARRAGALGFKVCGAGGGGCVAALAAEGRREAVAAALSRTGATVLEAPAVTRGLTVSARRG